MNEKSKNISLALFIVAAFSLFFFVVIPLLFGSIYSDLRLYFIGHFAEVTITEKKEGLTFTNEGDIPTYSIKTKEIPCQFKVSYEKYDTLQINGRYRAFISERLCNGFFTDNKRIYLYDCVIKNHIGNAILFLLLFFILIIAFVLQVNALHDLIRNEILVGIKEKVAENELLYRLQFTKTYFEYSFLLVFIYLVGIGIIKAAMIVEQNGPLVTGILLVAGLIVMMYFPFLLLRIRKSLLKKPFIEITRLIIEIFLAGWTLGKLLIFITSDIKFKTWTKLFNSFISFLFKMDFELPGTD